MLTSAQKLRVPSLAPEMCRGEVAWILCPGRRWPGWSSKRREAENDPDPSRSTQARSLRRLTLSLLVPVSSLGIYSAAASAPSLLPTLVASIGMVGLPRVASLTGEAKSAATWRAMLRATYSLVLISPVLAIILPWAIPFVYGTRYSAAVVPAEILLLGTVFSALTGVADDLLRGMGAPGS